MRKRLNKKETQRQNGEYWKQQMKEKINRDSERRESEFVKDPSSLWTIETKTRELDERKKQQQTNNEVKNILDGQVRFMNENRAQQQKNDFDTGSDLISQDL